MTGKWTFQETIEKTIEFENRTICPIEYRALLDVIMDLTCWISFVFLINDAKIKPVRVKGGMSLWNGMWHDVRNSIIMRNTRDAE